MDPHSIHIQERREKDNQWIATQYKLMDKDIGTLFDDWPIEWRILVNNEELSDTAFGSSTPCPNW